MANREIKIEWSDANQRFDKFLRKYLPSAPLTAIFKAIRTGKIKLNSKKAEQSVKLEEGDIICFYYSIEEIENFQKTENQKPKTLNSKLASEDIIFEDEDLCIVNKPAGLNVHPGDHKTTEVSLIELVQDYLGNDYNSLTFKPSLLHRIDRETSGVIVIVKNKSALEFLLSELQWGRIEKVYHTIVIGTPTKPRDTISARLLRVENAKDEAKVRIDPAGQTAVTHYATLKSKIQDKHTLLECRIETGRTHQIRVHLASISHPILGDKAYGNRNENAYAREHFDIHRQLLHAFSLTLRHPTTKQMMTIEAPYKEDMKKLMNGEYLTSA